MKVDETANLGSKYRVMLNQWIRVNKLQIITSLNQTQSPEVFCKKGVLKNFAKFAGKHLCWSLFFKGVTGLRSATSSKTESNTRVFL